MIAQSLLLRTPSRRSGFPEIWGIDGDDDHASHVANRVQRRLLQTEFKAVRLDAGFDSDIEFSSLRRSPRLSVHSRQLADETDQPEDRVIRGHIEVGCREFKVCFVLASASAYVQDKDLVPQRLHESVERRLSVDIEIDVDVVSGLRVSVGGRDFLMQSHVMESIGERVEPEELEWGG